MSFWPTDTAGQVADVISVVAFLSSIGAGLYSKKRGNATDRAVRELRKDFERRNLLPPTVLRYQKLYRELSPALSSSTNAQAMSQQLGELRGMLNGLDAYLEDTERGTVRLMVTRLDLIEKEPTAPSHLSRLLHDAAALSVELEVIVERLKWNSQS